MQPKLFDNVDDAIHVKDTMDQKRNPQIIHCGCHMMIAYSDIPGITEVLSVTDYLNDWS